MTRLSCRTLFGWMGGGLALLVLAGCRTPEAPPTSHAQWVPGKEQVRGADDEWPALRQQTLSVTGAVTLAELVDQAVQANPSLRQSWSEAKNAEAVVAQTKSAYYPSLTVQAGASRGRTDDNLLNEATGITTYGPQAQVQWLLLDLGGRSAAVRAAAEQLLASNYAFNQEFQDLLRDVQTAYYNVYGAHAAVTAAVANVDASRETLNAAEQREQAGLGMHLDVLQAQADHEKAQYDLVGAQSLVKTAQGQLAQAVGLPADADFQIAVPEQRLPGEDVPSEEEIGKVIDEALAQRPDIAVQRAGLASAQYAVKAVSSDLWPQLVAGGSADKTWNRYTASGLEDNDTYSQMGYAALSWDVFDGFLTRNRKRAAEAAREAARAQLRGAELAASADVWAKYYALVAATKKIDFAKASLASAQEAYGQALDKYNTGLKDITFLLNSQSQLAAARSTLVFAETEVYVAYVNFAHAMGALD